jgi:spore maturation protein CgeB/Tfp pilus assembly protein PilF
MITPRVLTFNFHEPYLCLMAKIGWPIDVGLYTKAPHAREWHTQFRPVPENLTFVDESKWRAAIEANEYDVVIAQNEMNAIDLLPCPVPSLLLLHNRRTFLETTLENGEKGRALYAEALQKLTKLFDFIFISESKRADYGMPGRVILPGIDVEDYGGYTGEVAEVLRVGNMMRHRNLMFDVDFQETVCRNLPNRFMGADPEIPYAEPSKSFDDLLHHYRTRRCMLHVTCGQYEDGYNLAMLEAMACGMPVVALANPTSPITDGVDGYTASDAGTLRQRLQTLLDEPELAAAIGERGRDTVAKKFPISRFVDNWRAAIEDAAARSTRDKQARQQANPPQESQAANPIPVINILADYVSSPCTWSQYLIQALRKTQNVRTIGQRVPNAILADWGFEPPFPDGPVPDIEVRAGQTNPALSPLIPESFKPDLYLWLDSGFAVLPADLAELPGIKVAYFIDTHMHLETRIEMARGFDYVFIAQEKQIEDFHRAGMQKVAWLPLACSPELHDLAERERTIDVAYIGSLSKHTDERRFDLMRRVAERYPNNAIGMRWPDQMAETYAQTKIVVNAAVKDDVNMRVFEAMASGALLITDDVSGLQDLFVDGQHLVVYHNDDNLFDLVDYFLEHDEERERIAAAGRALVYDRHTYDRRASQLVRMVLDDSGKLGGNAGESRFRKGGYYQRLRPEVAFHVPKFARRVLDCGCGGGEFGASLKERGVVEVVGVEIVERACEIAKQNLDQVIHGSIEDMELPFEENYFDCVVFADVLEHLVEPADALRKAAKCLSEDGLIVISIPNIRFYQQVQMLAEGRWEYEDAGIMDRTHLRFFCKEDLRLLIESAGLEVVKLQPLNVWPADRLPRDENGCLHLGKITIGPLDDEEYKEFLVYQYLVVAGHPGVDRLAPARRAQEAGQYELACQLANDAANVDHMDRLRLIAKSLASLGKLDNAEKFYRKILELAPDDPEVKGDLGMVLIAQNKLDDALPILMQAHEAAPENARFIGGLGLVAIAQGDPNGGLDCMLESLSIDNDNEQLLQHAVALARETNRLDEIDAPLAAYCEFRPGHAAMNFEYAQRLAESNRTAEAAERLELVLAVAPNHAGAQDLLESLRAESHEASA